MKSNKNNRAQRMPFIIWSWLRDPLVPVGIRFYPVRAKRPDNSGEEWVRASALLLDGSERDATCSDISVVTGKDFFQTEQRIPLRRLILWLKGQISDSDAANCILPHSDDR